MTILTVEPSEDTLTILAFLQARLPAAPAGYLHQLLKKGKILGDDGPLASADTVTAGDAIHLPDSGRLQELLDASLSTTQGLEILFESREILIVNKPSGIAIHSSTGHTTDNLTARAEALLAQRGDQFKIAPIHRLDLETSGPVLFGKGKKACGELGKIFMRQEVDKHYLALAAGKTPGSGKLLSTLKTKGKPKEALTEFRALARNDNASLLDLVLHSGRQHQIRRQLADLGHPLFGDRRYGGPCPPGLPRIFLHCRRLAFIDPFSEAPLQIDSPLPDDLDRFARSCNLMMPTP